MQFALSEDLTMPILAEETSLYPDYLLLDESPELYTTRQWWVLHTKVRQEKALARQLSDYGIPFFLPLIPKDNLIRGRRVRSFLPLFASYVFLYADEDERLTSLTTNRIAYALMVKDQNRLVRDLRQINQLILSDAPLTLERRLNVGQRVRVKKGSFAGMEGELTSRRGRTKFLVSISFLGQGVSIEIDDLLVEPI